MKFKIGDEVMVLDDAISGSITKIKDDKIYVETEDGFEFTFSKEELVLKESSFSSLQKEAFYNVSTDAVLAEKEASKKRKTIKIKPKQRTQPTLVVDLHIHKLTDSTRGMTNYDMLSLQLDTVTRQIEFAIRKRIQKLVFIHGVGEGVLKMELETLLRRFDNLKYYAADYKLYGYGATEVYFFQNVGA